VRTYRGRVDSLEKIFQKTFEKPLDKLQKMCYNKYRKQEIRNEREPRAERLKGWELKSHP
jgi:hypothetical protein